MKSFVLLALFVSLAFADLGMDFNETMPNGCDGQCQDVNTVPCGTHFESNLCPGPSNIRCCVKGPGSCTNGWCQKTSQSCSGHYESGHCPGDSSTQCCVSGGGGSCVTRDSIMARAQKWVNERVPYSQTKYHDSYRQDCSGYVNYCWQSGAPGRVTSTMPPICQKISKSEMRPGDCFLKPSEHTLLFGGWINSDSFHEYAEHTWGDVARKSVGSYSYMINHGFYPCRYIHTC